MRVLAVVNIVGETFGYERSRLCNWVTNEQGQTAVERGLREELGRAQYKAISEWSLSTGLRKGHQAHSEFSL